YRSAERHEEAEEVAAPAPSEGVVGWGMRISWLSAEEIAVARQALTANGATYDDHFGPEFASPDAPAGDGFLDWEGITGHVTRAARVRAIVREQGLEAARARFSGSDVAIEAATLAAAAHQDDALDLDEVIRVLRCTIDSYVFYAPFLELMIALSRRDLDVAVGAYEEFAAAYAQALATVPHGSTRVSAVRDGPAHMYGTAGRLGAPD